MTVGADVVVVTYNSAEELPDLLGVLGHDQPVTVVDNASTDGSADVAGSFGATVIRAGVNAGFAVACNRGAKAGTAPVIVFVNPDAVIDPASLGTLVAAFDDPGLGVASPRLRWQAGGEQRVRWPYPSARGAWLEALGLHRLRRGSGHGNEGFVVGACFAVRREAFEAVGGFDERFWLYGEEADLCFRLERAGWQVRVVKEAVATHVGGASEGPELSQQRAVAEHFERGGEHFVAKHGGSSSLVSYRLAALTGSVIRSRLRLGGRVEEHHLRARRAMGVLRRAPRTVPLDSPATRAPGRGLVVCSLEAWDEVWRRNQFLLRELLARDPDLRVLFVEPAFDVIHELQRRSGRRHDPGLRPVEGFGRIVCFEPVKWLPRRVGPCADRLRDRQVRNAVRSFGLDRPTLWVNDPSYATLADAVRWPVLYDITDDWTLLPDRRGAAAARNEEQLLERADSVVVCSADLASRRRDRRPDVALISNAVDEAHLRAPQQRPSEMPGGDVAVYVGTLHEDRLDVDLVERLSQELPSLTIVLVGPDALSAESRARLVGCRNVKILGPRPYRDVPGYLQHADVLVVPHRVTPFTDSLDPIKLYECLAVGRPTVATPLAGFRGAGPPVRVAEREHFVDAVREALTASDASQPADVPSWAERAEAFAAELGAARQKAEPRPLRVAFVDHCAQLSGGELALARLLPALERTISLVILGEEGPLVELLERDGVAVEVLPLDEQVGGTRRETVKLSRGMAARAGVALRDVLALRRRLRELHVDLVHTNSLKADLIGGLAARSLGVPLVWHMRDRLADDYLPRQAVRLMRLAARVLPHAVIANSAATAATLPPQVDVSVIGDPLARPVVETGAAARRPGPLRVAMVGRLAPWKGQDVFLRAFAKAFPNGEATAVIAGSAMFGEDEFAVSVQTLVEGLCLGGRVTLAGFVDDVPALLSETDVLVHASVLPEPFGQVIIEAMAAGCAVIASDAGGPSEIVTNETNGLLVPPGDIEALGAALRRLLAGPELRQRLAEAGLERAEDFLPGKVAGQVAELQSRIVSAAG